jgi:signal transduction histidine kinase
MRYPGARIELSGDLDRIGTLARFEILRIVEEGLRNAVRHAEASAIVARVAVSDGEVRLEVEDDGRGIGEVLWNELAREGRYGLIGIRERAALLRGTLRVERGIERGTIVRVDFPVGAE